MTLAVVIGTIAVTSAGAGGRAESSSGLDHTAARASDAPPADYVPRKDYLYVKRIAAKRLRLLGARERRIVRLLRELSGERRTRKTRPSRGSSGVRGAICSVFGAHCSEALRVAWCESRFNVYARNGQYLGLFQMGSFARAHYGHSWTAYGQSRAAYRYFRDAGWSPWACGP